MDEIELLSKREQMALEILLCLIKKPDNGKVIPRGFDIGYTDCENLAVHAVRQTDSLMAALESR